MSTLQEYITEQDGLVQAAAEALPHQFSRCTYPLGPLRQAVYLCLTCPEGRGLCSACSVACHTDHEQIELFPKRNFCCDCPTSSISHPCKLHTDLEPVNARNQYGQNFKAKFCRCGRPYDAATERETMIQCLSCEDWFHESCCNLRERPTSREPTPDPNPPAANDDDAASESSSSGLHPPLISADDYDAFVCGGCVSDIPILQRWAGSPGVLIVTRDTDTDPVGLWRVLKGEKDEAEEKIEVGVKRTRSTSPSIEAPEPKKSRGSPPTTGTSRTGTGPVCLAPSPNPVAQRVFAHVETNSNAGSGDVFLTEGFRERWCRCAHCLPLLLSFPFLLEEETTYEPPDDPDSGLSLDVLGMRALQQLPRDQAIDGIQAFNALRDNLVQYLRPFAEENKVVGEGDIASFFDALKESRQNK